jgi:hypothetical protein
VDFGHVAVVVFAPYILFKVEYIDVIVSELH